MRIYNTEAFIIRALIVHSKFYSYGHTVYVSGRIKVIITCPIHRDFLQTPHDHLGGHGCSKCRIDKTIKLFKYTTEIFIEKANRIYNSFYGYYRTTYFGVKEKVIITCPIHGDFLQSPCDHLQGKGCTLCGIKIRTEKNTKKLEEFIKEAKLIHITENFGYNEIVYKNSWTKVIIICKLHGRFSQAPSNHLQGQGCPRCCMSQGEKAIRKYLMENNIPFDDQFSFETCKNIKVLPFDFVLFGENKNIKGLIEYQGQQHFEPRERFGGIDGFNKLLKRDKIKKDFCITNKIPLLRIHYTDDTINSLKCFINELS